jgi:hypothetical protein
VLLGLTARAGETDHAALAKDMLTELGKAVKVLQGITDEDTASNARPELKKVGLRLDDLRKRARAAKQPNKAEKDKLEKEFQPKFDEVLIQLRTESTRVKGIAGGAEALRELALPPEKKADPEKDKKK